MADATATADASSVKSPDWWWSDAERQLKSLAALPAPPLRELVLHNAQLWNKVTTLESERTQLREKIIIAAHEAANNATKGVPTDDKLAKSFQVLQQKVHELQAELSNKYKAESASTKAQLSLSQEARELLKERDQLQEGLDTAGAHSNRLARELGACKEQLRKCEAECEVVKEELKQNKITEVKSVKAVREAETQMQQIVERTLNDKQWMIEEINNMTTALEVAKKKILELEYKIEQLERAQAAAAQVASATTEEDTFGFEKLPGPGGSWVSQVGVVVPTAADMPVQAHKGEATCLSFNEDGTMLATGGSDGTVKLWTASAVQPIATLRATAATTTAASQPIMCVHMRGSFVVGGSSDFKCRVWGLDTQRVRHTLTGHGGKVYAAKFSPDCRMVVTGGTDRKIMVWDMANGYRVKVLSCGSICNTIDVSETGVLLASGHQDKSVKVWNIHTGKLMLNQNEPHTAPVTSVSFSHSGSRILTCSKDNMLRIFNASSLECEKTLSDPDFAVSISWAQATFSPDGAYVAAGSRNGTLVVWDVSTGEVSAKLPAGTGSTGSAIEAVAWSPKGKEVVACDFSGMCTWYRC